MSHDELKRAFREATATVPPGARERVWRGLEEAPARRSESLRLALALAASIVAGVGLTQAFKPDGGGAWHDDDSAVVWTSARVRREGARVTVDRGEVAVSSWGKRLDVAAKGHTLGAEAGAAIVHVAGDSVRLEVLDGVVYFDGTAQVAKPRADSTPHALASALEKLESSAAQGRRLLARAELAVGERRYEEATQALARVAASSSLSAEVANFKQGEVELRHLNRPHDALTTFEAGMARFPHGALQQERALSAIESCVKLGVWGEVEKRTTEFLSAHESSERADELRVLHASAVLNQGRLGEACSEASMLPRALAAAILIHCP